MYNYKYKYKEEIFLLFMLNKIVENGGAISFPNLYINFYFNFKFGYLS